MDEHIIGYIAATLTTISFLPQAIKTIKTHNTKGISFLMYMLFVVGVGFWMAYGFILNNPAMIISNFITFILAGFVLAIKIKNRD